MLLAPNPPPATKPLQATRKRAAAAAVEFALVGSVFFILVLGFIELARGLMTTHLLSNAARAGCRVGILTDASTSAIEAATNDTLSRQGLPTSTIAVTVNDAVADASTAKSGDEITVTVTVEASRVTWIPGTRYLVGNLSGSYSLRRE